MAEPRNINRDIGTVSPNNYTNPGVVDTSTGQIIAAVGGAVVEADKMIQSRKLDKELEALRTEWVTKPAQNNQFAPEDQQVIADFSNALQKGARAREQGVRNITWDSYRMRGETLLRTAIAARPGLAEEFRRIAANTLGTDVVGATALFLAEQEAAANKPKDAGYDVPRLRDDLEDVGMPNGHLTDEQVLAVAREPKWAEAMQARTQLSAEVSQATRLKEQRDLGMALNAPQNRQLFRGLVSEANLDLFSQASRLESLLANGAEIPAEERAAAVNRFKFNVSQIRSQLAASAADTLPPEQVKEELAHMDTLMTHIDSMVSGQNLTELTDTDIKLATNLVKRAAMRDPNFANTVAMSEALGPAVMEAAMNRNPVLADAVVQSLQYGLSGTGDPIVAATNAKSVLDSVITNMGKQTPEQAANSVQTLIGVAGAFSEVPARQYNPEAYGQYIQGLGISGKVVANRISPEQKVQLAETTAMGTAVFMHRMRTIVNNDPSYGALRGNVEWGLSADGTMARYTGEAPLSRQDADKLKAINSHFAVGRNTITVLSDLGGLERNAAVEKVNAIFATANAQPSAARPKTEGQKPSAGFQVSLGDGSSVEINQEGYEQYKDTAMAKAEQHGVPASVLTSLITQESRWNADAKSETSVRGLAQVTRATAGRFGYTGEEYTKPENQLDAAAQYLSFLHKKFKGDWNLAVAAYNAGEGALDKFLRTGQRTGNLAKGGNLAASGSSQAETYVAKVMGFDADLLEYGRNVMGYEDPEERKQLAEAAAKERG